MIEIDTAEVAQFESDLKTFARRAYPFATKQTVNRSAFEARKQYQENMRDDLTLRNKWTVNSVRVEQTRELSVPRQAAIVGSLADYMAVQEFGGTVEPERGENQPIATGYSAGQEGARPRTRLPRKPNKRSSITLRKRGRGQTSRRARNVLAIKEAAAQGDKFVYLDMGRTRGIFRVLGGKRRPRIRMVWDLSRRSVSVPRNPLLAPAVAATQQKIPAIYQDALAYQLRRQKLLGY